MTSVGSRATIVHRRLQGTAIACFFTSGLLSLVYEICWIRKASLVFGSASFALSTVLAVFFAGLAAGSYWFGRRAVTHGRPLRCYAVIELAVALVAMASPATFAIADRIFGWLYPSVCESFAWLSCVRFLLLALILLPPAVLMGGTLPLFCRQFVRSEAGVLRSVGLLYGLNTVGALLGCAATGFFLVPTIGVNATLWWGAAVNLLLAAVAWQLPLTAPEEADESVPVKQLGTADLGTDSPVHRCRRAVLGGTFFCLGFAALGHEVLWARFLSLLMYNTVHTYTLTITVVLAGIFLGSTVAAIALADLRRLALALGIIQLAVGVVVSGTVFLPAGVWAPWRNVDSVAGQLGLVALVMLPAAIVAGAAFPVAARLATSRAERAAADVGRLTAINTLGGIAGSLMVGFVLLPWLGLHVSAVFTTGICIANGLVIGWTFDLTMSRRVKGALSALAVGSWLLATFANQTRLPADFLAPRDRLVTFREGCAGNVAVVRDGPRLRLEVDRLWQGENGKTHQIVAAHLPMLLHEDPRRVLVIGLGPGQTASRFLMYPILQLDCVEIEGELLPLLRRYFRGQWLDDPRVRCVVEDGRNYVAHTDQRYDVISVEVGQAFRPGVASFYSYEFYKGARKRLCTRGLIAQFVSLKFLNRDELRTVIRTFHEVFPESVLCHNRAELLLIGQRDGRLRLSDRRLALLESNVDVSSDLSYRYWGGHDRCLRVPEVFAANLLLGPAELDRISRGARVYRDDLPFLEYSTSSHQIESVGESTKLLQQHLTPIRELTCCSSLVADPQRSQVAEAVRQRNLANLLAEELVTQAEAALAAGPVDRVVSLLRSALQHNPENLRANLLMADTLVARHQVAGAMPYYRTLLALDETNPLIHLRLTFACEKIGDSWEARRHLRRAEELGAGRTHVISLAPTRTARQTRTAQHQ